MSLDTLCALLFPPVIGERIDPVAVEVAEQEEVARYLRGRQTRSQDAQQEEE